jgi:HAD superfamily hydrolase (TIGR01509 family)
MGSGVLFDVDGTLVDTTYLHAVTWWQALRQHDHDVPMAHIHRAIGMGSDKILDALLGSDHDTSRDDEVRAAHSALYAQYWDRLRPQPGAAQLVRACAGRGLTVGLASSAAPPEFAVLRRTLGVDDVVAGATNAGDAEESKPDPDIVQAALDRTGLAPERVVFVGDSVWDVYAAARLDIPCIGLTCGGISAAELGDAGAVAIYRDPADLHTGLDRLPRRALDILNRAGEGPHRTVRQ